MIIVMETRCRLIAEKSPDVESRINGRRAWIVPPSFAREQSARFLISGPAIRRLRRKLDPERKECSIRGPASNSRCTFWKALQRLRGLRLSESGHKGPPQHRSSMSTGTPIGGAQTAVPR